jgi:hypothetical protein
MRNIYIALAVTAVILFGGGLLLRHAGGTAVQVVTVVAVAVGFVVLHALDGRDRRHKQASRKTA